MPSSSAGKRRPETNNDGTVVVGTVTGASGLRGELRVAPLTDHPGRFSPGSTVYLGDQPAKVISSRKSGGVLVVKLDLVNDRTHAESLRDAVLTVPPEDLEPLPEGSYYHFHIMGIEVWDEDGRRLGTVRSILKTGSNDVYVVRSADGGELLVPALKDVLLEVSPAENRMVVRLPEGL